MKRFLILFILILFVTVSCAGPNKVEWSKSNFHQDEFEKDRKECIQTANKKSYSQTSGVFDDCLALRGYKYEAPSESPSVTEVAKIVGKVLLYTGLIVVALPLFVLSQAPEGQPHRTWNFR